MKKFVCLALCTLLWAGLVQAQGVTTGSMSGVVVDPNQDPLPGVAVVATLPATGNRYGTVTDVEGRFRMVNLKAGGPYEVQASLAGFKTHTLGDVTIRLGRDLDEPGDRAPARGGDRRHRGILRDERADQPDQNGRRELGIAGLSRSLATFDRSVYDMARTNPVFQTYSCGEWGNGPRFRCRAGTRATTPSRSTVRSTTTSSASPPAALRAARPKPTRSASTRSRSCSSWSRPSTSSRAASPAAASTPSPGRGSNDFHGSVFGSQRDSTSVAARLDREFANFQEDQYGVTFGGPIAKDKLFFFANDEHNPDESPTGVSADGSTGDRGRTSSRRSAAELRPYLISGTATIRAASASRPRAPSEVFLRFVSTSTPSHNGSCATTTSTPPTTSPSR